MKALTHDDGDATLEVDHDPEMEPGTLLLDDALLDLLDASVEERERAPLLPGVTA